MAKKDEKLDINMETKLADSKQSEKPNRGTVELEKEYKNKSYRLEGGSTKVFKKRIYTGLKRKDIKR